MRTLSAMVVAAALLLVGAAPASAVTGGFGVAKALKGVPLPISFAQASGRKTHKLCEASRSTTKTTNVVTEIERQFVPVACEQPPRSRVLTADQLKNATAAALAVIG